MERRTLLVFLTLCLVMGGLIALKSAPDIPVTYDTNYSPDQPIKFSHRLHAGELKVDCQYCHSSADRSRHAGIPSLNTCMNCHSQIKATAAQKQTQGADKARSEEIAKIYAALGLNEQLQPDPDKTPKPVEWIQIHRLPDYVAFDHSRHVNGGVACQTCHGQVENMERVRQEANLSMGWCLRCHRDVNEMNLKDIDHKPVPGHIDPMRASTDCAVCHY